jgi:serine protease Do
MNPFTTSLTASLVALGIASLNAQTPPTPPDPPVYAFWAGAVMSGSFLGVGVAELSSDRAKALNVKEEYGVEITHVEEDSPAEKAGLKAGDVVQEYNGQRVEGLEQFQRLVRETPAGRSARLAIVRNGATQTLTATIGARKGKHYESAKELFGPGGIELPEIHIPDIPQLSTSWRTAILGVEAESLGPQLAEYFGVKEGVLVRAVLKGSAAEKAGIKAGDVITKVDQTSVTSAGEVSTAARAARSKKSFPLQLVRDHHEMIVTVTVDEDRSEQTPASRVKVVHPNNH